MTEQDRKSVWPRADWTAAIAGKEREAQTHVDPLCVPCPLAAATLSSSFFNVLYYGLSDPFCPLIFSLPFYAFVLPPGTFI